MRITGSYQGIIIQARENDSMSETPLGTFALVGMDMNFQLTNCTNDDDTLTHTDGSTVKNDSNTFQWMAPADLELTVIFVWVQSIT